MLDRVVIQPIARKQYTHPSLGSIVISAYLVQLPESFPGLLAFPELEVSFRQKVKILWLVRMQTSLLAQFRQVELSAFLRSKLGPVVKVVKKVLIRIRPGRRVFRERLENVQIPLRGLELAKTSLHHG